MKTYTANNAVNDKAIIIPYGGNDLVEFETSKLFEAGRRDKLRGETFHMRNNRVVNTNKKREEKVSSHNRSSITNLAMYIAGKAVSGLIFILILTWAVPLGYAKMVDVRVMMSDAISSDYATSNWSPVVGSPRAYEISDEISGDYVDGQATRIAVPEYLARELENFYMPGTANNNRIPSSDRSMSDNTSDADKKAQGFQGLRAQLSGVICDNSSCVAVIDNSIVKEGDIVAAGLRIEKIDYNSVTIFSTEDNTLVTRLGF